MREFWPGTLAGQYNDGSQPVTAYWCTPLMNLGTWSNVKTVTNVWVVGKPYSRSGGEMYFMGWLVIGFAACMLLDWITGSVAGSKKDGWSSATARAGLWHKGGMLVVVVVAAALDGLLGIIISLCSCMACPRSSGLIRPPFCCAKSRWPVTGPTGAAILPFPSRLRRAGAPPSKSRRSSGLIRPPFCCAKSRWPVTGPTGAAILPFPSRLRRAGAPPAKSRRSSARSSSVFTSCPFIFLFPFRHAAFPAAFFFFIHTFSRHFSAHAFTSSGGWQLPLPKS